VIEESVSIQLCLDAETMRWKWRVRLISKGCDQRFSGSEPSRRLAWEQALRSLIGTEQEDWD
jgi:hypothetical protein